ncbi:L-ribulose-5-phosphate 4-epimerase ulaF [Escherichia coli]|uniref:L-ribulose-5-phosphate 4-epimerase ulaF n=1 Tax=Escherichia coli TaxID=562 RepID=A0A377E483_ECOLX|nr:L-ribulose-5-phosphate 4-epimerase ulaF [Escherichia coli]
MYQHGPFAWGKDAHDAVHNAVVMEEVAKMAWIARSINPQLNHIDSYLMNNTSCVSMVPTLITGRSKTRAAEISFFGR